MDFRAYTFDQAIRFARAELRRGHRALAAHLIGQAESSLALVTRALAVATRRARPQPWLGRPRLPDTALAAMYRDYWDAGMSLNAVGKKYGRDRRSVGELFRRRGLQLRVTCRSPERLPNGRIKPKHIHTPAEIDALISALDARS